MASIKNDENFSPEKMDKMFASRVELQQHVLKNTEKGNIQSIIDAIDVFGWTKQWLMNIGDRKGKILDQAIERRQPKTILELGTFLGYSSLRIVAQLPQDALFVTIEADSQSADIARSLHQHADVADRIHVVNDYTENVIPRLGQQFHIDSFDLIFIDHYKDVYLRDFKMLEQTGLIKSGTMIVADNVIIPGAPDYLEYVRNNPNYTTTCHKEYLEYNEDLLDAVEISIRN